MKRQENVYLGIDTAQVNCGFTVLSAKFDWLLSFNSAKIDTMYLYDIQKQTKEKLSNFSQTFDYEDSKFTFYSGKGVHDYLRNYFIVGIIKALHQYFNIELVIMEGPAFGASFNSFSLGSIYGVVENTLYENNISFLVVPPNPIKYAILGKAKDTNKRDIMNALKQNFGLSFNDSNMSDSAVMAMLAYHLGETVISFNSKLKNIAFFDEVSFKEKYGSAKSRGYIHELAESQSINKFLRTESNKFLAKLKSSNYIY